MSLLLRVRQSVKVLVHTLAPGMAVKKAFSNKSEAEPELELLPELVDSSRAAIDVGGNLGTYTHRLVGLAKKVTVFEAHPRLASVLSRSFPQAEVRNEAVSDQHGQVTLRVPRRDGLSIEGLGSLELASDEPNLESFSVPAVTLDDLGDRDAGFIKIDVEGHELHVLNGARGLIARQRPVFLVETEERHKAGSVQEVFAFFKALDYVGIFVYGKDVLPVEQFTLAMQDVVAAKTHERPEGLYANNFIFFPAEKWSTGKLERLIALRRKTAPASTPEAASVAGANS
ncbi:MAG TPA: FkbM family methyltransferase [Candidatus Methylacidiphilales bacterium]|jgi:FkbM family methyltransferase|nr:FkbM family methyltransferase [Candidatus Methylacidiphilales bacterium]